MLFSETIFATSVWKIALVSSVNNPILYLFTMHSTALFTPKSPPKLFPQ
jgi:hypothetical protein